MLLIYNFGIKLYELVILLASPFNEKAGKWVKGRKDIIQKIKSTIHPDDKTAWFHCASLGEFEQGRPLIEKFKKNYPSYKILLTFFSPSGYEVRKDYEFADYIFYLPIDSKRNARIFVDAVNPNLVFFIKYEIWFHYFKELKRNHIPLFIISANFRKNQVYFRWFGEWFRRILANPAHIFVQSNSSEVLLKTHDINNVSVSGDTRFDRVYEISQTSKPIPIIEKFCRSEKKVLIAGSTWQEDEALLTRLIDSGDFDMKFIIAPHVINEEDLADLRDELKPKTVLFSEANDENIEDAEVLIIDSIGMLSRAYRYGDIAYIGGGFGAGIHNVLEPAVFGMPVIFGPNYDRFRESVELLVKGGAFEIGSYDDLQSCIGFLLHDPHVLLIASEVSRNYIRENTGATDKIFEYIERFVDGDSGSATRI